MDKQLVMMQSMGMSTEDIAEYRDKVDFKKLENMQVGNIKINYERLKFAHPTDLFRYRKNVRLIESEQKRPYEHVEISLTKSTKRYF